MVTHAETIKTVESSSAERAASNRKLWIVLALAAVYLIWGTTYLGIAIALESFPPYLMMGLRFLMAGAVLFVFLRARGAELPTLKQWRSAGIVGVLLLVGGMGSVALAEQTVDSGLAATLVAVSPVFAMLFSMLWGDRPSAREWIGVLLGIAGVILLTFEGNLQANLGGVGLMIFATASWAFGSVWSRHLEMPKGAMANAAEMLLGGAGLMLVALVRGEQIIGTPTQESVLALLYLTTAGSLVTITAYMYLLKTVSPALALSYAFVNPAIALLLGVWLGGEVLTGSAPIALPVILLGVAFVAFKKK